MRHAPPDSDINARRVIARRLKAVRLYRGQSMVALGDALGVTFQQVQKYESGANRIAADTLVTAARVLGVHPVAFFEGLQTPEDRLEPASAAEAEALLALRSLPAGTRTALLGTIRDFADLYGARAEHAPPPQTAGADQ